VQTLENWNVAMLDLTPYKPQLIELCKTFSVERLDLVGSAVREDFDAERSDIDVLIQFAGKENLFHRYFDLKFKLEELFVKKVDMLQEGAIDNPYVKASLEKDRVSVYAA
jgi:hypothetical protein